MALLASRRADADGITANAVQQKSPPTAVLAGVNADPHIAFFGDRCFLYPTTDGSKGWRATSFQAWSSDDLATWKNEGVILDLPRDIAWADMHAWAPAIATKDGKFYFYFSANKKIGVAVADRPEGPFHDPLGRPLVSAGDYRGMQCIDPMVYVDEDGAAYLYWGQGRCKAAPLNDDMISFDPGQVLDITPPGYNEAPFVHRRGGVYYLSWSEYDTRDPRYSVAYGRSDSPLGPFAKADENPILQQRSVVRGAGHHSVGKLPGRDEWVIAYHRFRIPGGDGYHRETCLSPLRHNDAGDIQPVDVFEGVEATNLSKTEHGDTESDGANSDDAQSEQAKSQPAGFLFVTFRGEATPMTEQVYFALSKDGRRWEALNDAEPVLVSDLGEQGVRDPYILKSHDASRFYLIATDLSINLNRDWGRAVRSGSRAIIIWESTDLVTWSKPRRVEVAPKDAGCTWAPEAIYDPDKQSYLVFWASTTGRDDYAKHRIWAARTKDFRAFSEPFIYIEKPTTVIDTTIVHHDDSYYRFTKDEKFKAITLETAPQIDGPWTDIPEFSMAKLRGYEGPACYQLQPATENRPAVWSLILDHYAKGRGYQPFVTNNLAGGDFEKAESFSFPFKFRHGSVLPLSSGEYARLQDKYGDE